MYGPRNSSGGSGRGRYGQNPSFRESGTGVSLERVETAVLKARNDLLAAGESISTWKLAQSVVLSLQVQSWEALRFRLNDVPSLQELQFVEGKVNAFMHCFVSTRRMTSVHELGIELCKNEGVEQFDELGLGPLLRHPLVQHYFLIPSDAVEVCKITVEEMIAHLAVFQRKMMFKELEVEKFLDYLMQKYSVASREELGVRIQNIKMYINFIRKIQRTEVIACKSIQQSGLPWVEPHMSSDSNPEDFNSVSFMVDGYDESTYKETGTLKDDGDGNEVECSSSSRRRRGRKRQSFNAQNSTDVDEMKCIGMKRAMFNYRNCGRELLENEDLRTLRRSQYKIIPTVPAKAGKLSLADDGVERFVATRKGACQKRTVDEDDKDKVQQRPAKRTFYQMNRGAVPPQQQQIGQPNRGQIQPPAPRPICTYCHKSGHFECDCRMAKGLCLICGSGNHKAAKCPSRIIGYPVPDQYPALCPLPAPLVPAVLVQARPPPPSQVPRYQQGQHGQGQAGCGAGQVGRETGQAYIMDATEAGTSDDLAIDTGADDIIKQVASYFGLDHLTPGKKDQIMDEKAVIRD